MQPFIRTHQIATLSNNRTLDRKLDEVLLAIREAIASWPEPLKSQLVCIWLGGGYGRGEGGCLLLDNGDPAFYNDLDFFVFSHQLTQPIKLDIITRLAAIAHEWSDKLSISVDFNPPQTLATLKRNRTTLMFQELLHGHIVVWGDSDLPIHPLAEEQIPLSEALRLMLNRGTGLLLAECQLRSETPDVEFIVRNLNKAILGMADAWLIAVRQYHWTIQARQATLFPGPFSKDLQKLYTVALTQKATPVIDPSMATIERLDQLKNLWSSMLRLMLQMPRQTSQPEPYFKRSIYNVLRIVIHNKTLSLSGRSPLKIALEALQILLQAKAPLTNQSSCVTKYIAWWQRFN